MKVQVLVSTMHQSNHDLLERMNIQTDAIVVNQCDNDTIETFLYNGNTIKWLSLNERGVGLSRNSALMRADAEVVLFADDDVYYNDDYASLIIAAFNRSPNADAIILNLRPPEGPRKLKPITSVKRLNYFNGMRYGTVHLAAKLSSLRRENINFSLLFGGGAKYSAGEDTIFIMDCLKHRLKVYTCPDYIGGMIARASTWFQGYNDKYLFDKGAVYRAVSKMMARPLCLQLLIRHKEMWRSNDLSFFGAYKLMCGGIREMSSR